MAFSNKLRYQEIILDSGDYKYGNKNTPIFQFDQQIDDSQYFQVQRVTIPTTYYVFDESRTQMGIDGSTVTWDPGNYTVQEWLALANSQLAGADIQVTYSDITNKLKFESDTNNFTILFDSNNPQQHGAQELGFEQDVVYDSTTGGAGYIFSPYVVNFSGPNFVYLRSPMASIFNNRDMFFTNTTVTNTGGDILAMIPIDQNRNSVVNYIDESDQFLQWQNVGNKRIEMYFTLGRRLDKIDFNGQTFQITIHGYSMDDNKPYQYN